MDPEWMAGLAAGVLALLGLRRRSGAPAGSPTPGQQLASRAGALSDAGVSQIRRIGTAATGATASAGEAGVWLATWLGAGALRTAGRMSTGIAAGALGVAARVTTSAAGLVVDGGLAAQDAAVAGLRALGSGVVPPRSTG